MARSECNQCGAHIKWANVFGRWMPFNAEDVEEDFDPQAHEPHWKTCKKEKESQPLSYEATRRPGYL